MTITLAKDMARPTTDISDELLERWLELRCCFSVYSSLTLLSTIAQRLLLILILLFYLFMLARTNNKLRLCFLRLGLCQHVVASKLRLQELIISSRSLPCLVAVHITHTPKRWSNEAMMIDYIKNIIIPYVECQWHQLQQCSPALVIIDNFRGQISPAINELLEENGMHISLLPPNTYRHIGAYGHLCQ